MGRRHWLARSQLLGLVSTSGVAARGQTTGQPRSVEVGAIHRRPPTLLPPIPPPPVVFAPFADGDPSGRRSRLQCSRRRPRP